MNRKILINLPDKVTSEEVSDFITRVSDESFTNNKNQPLKVNEMNNHIKRRYAKFLPEANMSQSLIYKIIQNHYEELGDIKKLQEIAELRGHRIDTQLNNYSSTI